MDSSLGKIIMIFRMKGKRWVTIPRSHRYQFGLSGYLLFKRFSSSAQVQFVLLFLSGFLLVSVRSHNWVKRRIVEFVIRSSSSLYVMMSVIGS